MEFFDYRIFVCIRERPAPQSSCAGHGAHDTVQALKAEIARRGLVAQVKVNQSSCLDLCTGGPHLIVYPEGTWYSGLTPESVADFVEAQLVRGVKYAPLLRTEEELKDIFAVKKVQKAAKAAEEL